MANTQVHPTHPCIYLEASMPTNTITFSLVFIICFGVCVVAVVFDLVTVVVFVTKTKQHFKTLNLVFVCFC